MSFENFRRLVQNKLNDKKKFGTKGVKVNSFSQANIVKNDQTPKSSTKKGCCGKSK